MAIFLRSAAGALLFVSVLLGTASEAAAWGGYTDLTYSGSSLNGYSVTWADWWDAPHGEYCYEWAYDPEYGYEYCVYGEAWDDYASVEALLYTPSGGLAFYGYTVGFPQAYYPYSGSPYENGTWTGRGNHYVEEDHWYYDYRWGWTYGGRSSFYLGSTSAQANVQPPPPEVNVTGADIVGDQINVSLGPGGLSGNLIVRVGSTEVFNGNRSAGSHTFSFNRENLPAGEYSSVTAEWSTSNGTGNGSRPVNFRVMGVWRHSQYNSPNETACNGSQAPAYITNPSCGFSSVTLKSDFISQSWLNGSGITINHGTEQNEAFCLNNGSPPPDAGGRSFRPQAIIPSCGGGYSVNNSTVARGDDAGLSCGDQVLIVGVGIKTVTDRCPACTGRQQLDNYTTQAACSPGSIGDLGNFQTIQLR